MRKIYYLIIALVASMLAWPLLAQEEDTQAPVESAAPAEDAAESETPEELDEFDDSDLDEQTYEEDEDDFVPTQEIPADTPIPFPSNI